MINMTSKLISNNIEQFRALKEEMEKCKKCNWFGFLRWSKLCVSCENKTYVEQLIKNKGNYSDEQFRKEIKELFK